jgi:hypothetical protein
LASTKKSPSEKRRTTVSSKSSQAQRLAAAIENFNRRLKNKLIRFRGNGLGTGICWEPRE